MTMSRIKCYIYYHQQNRRLRLQYVYNVHILDPYAVKKFGQKLVKYNSKISLFFFYAAARTDTSR